MRGAELRPGDGIPPPTMLLATDLEHVKAAEDAAGESGSPKDPK